MKKTLVNKLYVTKETLRRLEEHRLREAKGQMRPDTAASNADRCCA